MELNLDSGHLERMRSNNGTKSKSKVNREVANSLMRWSKSRHYDGIPEERRNNAKSEKLHRVDTLHDLAVACRLARHYCLLVNLDHIQRVLHCSKHWGSKKKAIDGLMVLNELESNGEGQASHCSKLETTSLVESNKFSWNGAATLFGKCGTKNSIGLDDIKGVGDEGVHF